MIFEFRRVLFLILRLVHMCHTASLPVPVLCGLENEGGRDTHELQDLAGELEMRCHFGEQIDQKERSVENVNYLHFTAIIIRILQRIVDPVSTTRPTSTIMFNCRDSSQNSSVGLIPLNQLRIKLYISGLTDHFIAWSAGLPVRLCQHFSGHFL